MPRRHHDNVKRLLILAAFLCFALPARAQVYPPPPVKNIAPNMNAIYLSPNCGTQTNCYPVAGGVQYVNDASWTSSGTTVTTGSGDPPFTSANVGKIEFGTSNCNTANGYIDCQLQVPQGTIVSITDAHDAVVSSAATATSSAAAAWFAWGKADDTTAINTAFAALLGISSSGPGLTNGGNTLVYPCTSMFVSSAIMQVTTEHMNGLNVKGCPSAYIIALPTFTYTNANGTLPLTGISGAECGQFFCDWLTNETRGGYYLQNPSFWDRVEDFHVWGLGTEAGNGSSTEPCKTSEVCTAFAGGSVHFEHTDIEGWNWSMEQGSQTGSGSNTNCTFDIASSSIAYSFSQSSGACGFKIENGNVTQGNTTLDNALWVSPERRGGNLRADRF